MSFTVIVTFLSLVDLLFGCNGKDNNRIEDMIDELDRSRCVAGLNHMKRKKKVGQYNR